MNIELKIAMLRNNFVCKYDIKPDTLIIGYNEWTEIRKITNYWVYTTAEFKIFMGMNVIRSMEDGYLQVALTE